MDIKKPYEKKKAAVFVLLGQSNAVGHALPMSSEDVIRKPLKNVFGLNRRDNQSFNIKSLTWSGYTSLGMNLGEEQDDTYSVANCLAGLWQSETDHGNNNLPDLYIVHIAIGAQGVTKGYMWNPGYEKKLIPGKLNTADISLTPFTGHILSLLKESFDKMDMDFEMLGIHWRGCENDTIVKREELTKSLKPILVSMLDGFAESTGKPCPVVLHLIACRDRCLDFDPDGGALSNMHYINDIYKELSEEKAGISLFDVTKCPLYIPGIRGNGIFKEDAVHYTPEVNRWVAECILKNYMGN